MSEEQNVQELLKQGIEAARAGKKADARRLFEQVVELDDRNEKGWLWLYSVVDTDEEKRVCLSNVLFINPANERAQKAMQQIEEKAKQALDQQEVIPGVTRRQLMLLVGGGGAVVILIIAILAAVGASRSAQIASQTQAAVDAQNTSTMAVAMAATESFIGTATQDALATATPTASNTPNRPTLPPEFSPTPTDTPVLTSTPLAPPVGLTGKLVAASGRDASRTGFLPIVLFTLGSNVAPVTISEGTGRNPDISRDGQRVAYTRYFPATFDFALGQVSTNGTGATVLTEGLPVIKAQMPSYCSDGDRVAFVGVDAEGRDVNFTGEQAPLQVFVLSIATRQLNRITQDRATYTYPAYSPDCTRLAVVRDEVGAVNAGADIYVVDLVSRTAVPLTTDLGAFIETSPRWSTDGTQIIYAAYPATDPGNSDIAIRGVDGSAAPLVPVRTTANDIFPVLSPDGRYIAFASNPNGPYDIFILDRQDNVFYQLTSTEDDDYPGAWVP